MKINKLILDVTKDYMPFYKEIKRKQKELIKVANSDLQTLFELSTKLELFKIMNSSFMETIITDQKGKVTEYFIKNNLITYHKEKAVDKNNNEVEVDVVNESMEHVSICFLMNLYNLLLRRR